MLFAIIRKFLGINNYGSAAGAILSDIWTENSLPTIDCLGDEFLDTVKTGDKIRVEEDGTVTIL